MAAAAALAASVLAAVTAPVAFAVLLATSNFAAFFAAHTAGMALVKALAHSLAMFDAASEIHALPGAEALLVPLSLTVAPPCPTARPAAHSATYGLHTAAASPRAERTARPPDGPIAPDRLDVPPVGGAVPDCRSVPRDEAILPPTLGRPYGAAVAIHEATRVSHLFEDPSAKVPENPLHHSPLPSLASGKVSDLLPLVVMKGGSLTEALNSLCSFVLEIGGLATGNPEQEPLDQGKFHLLYAVVASPLSAHGDELGNGRLVVASSADRTDSPSSDKRCGPGDIATAAVHH